MARVQEIEYQHSPETKKKIASEKKPKAVDIPRVPPTAQRSFGSNGQSEAMSREDKIKTLPPGYGEPGHREPDRTLSMPSSESDEYLSAIRRGSTGKDKDKKKHGVFGFLKKKKDK